MEYKYVKTNLLITGLACVSLLVLASGCTGVRRYTPVAGATIQANMNSGDCQVLGKTEGSSTRTSYLCGFYQVIDGDKVKVLGIKFFEDQYAFREDSPSRIHTEERAYFKALAAAPDADMVVAKAYLKTMKGFWPFWSREEVTFQGKALKFKGGN